MADFDPTHPGEILMTEFLEPMGITQYRIAKAIDVPPRRINEIVHGKRAITADTALRLSRALGLSDMFFINMQAHYDAEVARETASDRIGHDRADRLSSAELNAPSAARQAGRRRPFYSRPIPNLQTTPSTSVSNQLNPSPVIASKASAPQPLSRSPDHHRLHPKKRSAHWHRVQYWWWSGWGARPKHPPGQLV